MFKKFSALILAIFIVCANLTVLDAGLIPLAAEPTATNLSIELEIEEITGIVKVSGTLEAPGGWVTYYVGGPTKRLESIGSTHAVGYDYAFLFKPSKPAKGLYKLKIKAEGMQTPTEMFFHYVPSTSGYEIPYEPERWNDSEQIYRNNNCYAYALNRKIDGFSQPGYLAGILLDPSTAFKESDNGAQIIYACQQDAAAIGGVFIPIGRNEPCPEGTYKVALVISPNSNYHFYRQNRDGFWSHKPGFTFVIDIDYSGRKIFDPQFSDRFTGDINFTMFIGYFAVAPTSDGPSANDSVATMRGDDLIKTDNFAPDISASLISSIEKGMTVSQVRSQLGLPQDTFGSGVLMDAYNLEDGNRLIINYGFYRNSLFKAAILTPNGEWTFIIE